MRRIWHHYLVWEDYRAGMFRISENMDADRGLARDLLRNPDHLREAMGEVAFMWNNAAEQNITDTSSNRRAWLGQAACCYVHGSPQDMTCAAWWTLTDEERVAANAVADEVIVAWERARSNAPSLFERADA